MSAVVDLFAGPGGFDIAARELGMDPLGIEWDSAACATREAAGLRTLQADVSALDPHAVMREHFPGCGGSCCGKTGRGEPRCLHCPERPHALPLVGLVGGPPCPAFSMAGKGEGRHALPFYVAAIERMGRGEQIDRAEMDEACGDERAHLVLEPLRWALALRPRWIVLEQVPPVLPLWEATATALRAHGYATWTGILSAEQFGVPQTRKRAFLIASLDGPVSAPQPTHQRYVAPRRHLTDGRCPTCRDYFARHGSERPDSPPSLAEITAAKRLGLPIADYVAKRAAGEKWCTGCKDWHPVAAFGPDRSRTDGRAARCRAATRGRAA